MTDDKKAVDGETPISGELSREQLEAYVAQAFMKANTQQDFKIWLQQFLNEHNLPIEVVERTIKNAEERRELGNDENREGIIVTSLGKKTYNDWVDDFANRTDGVEMASMGDYYKDFKRLRTEFAGNLSQKLAIERQLLDYRNDMDWEIRNNWLFGRDKIIYADSFNAEIVRELKEGNIKFMRRKPVQPSYTTATRIDLFVNDYRGADYIQAFFDTEDRVKEIIETLEVISNKSRDNIYINPPVQPGEGITRVLGLGIRNSRLEIVNGVFSAEGICHGVKNGR